MTNPFDDVSGMYLALKNDEGQYSQWPDFIDVPEGWTIVSGPSEKSKIEEYIRDQWKDMRPISLLKSMD